MLPQLITDLVTVLTDNFPFIIDTGINLILALVDGILEALPQLIDQMPEIITKLVMALAENAPKIIEAGIKIITSLQSGVINAIPQLIAQIPKLVTQLASTLAQNMPKILAGGKNIITSLVSGVKSVLSSIGAIGKTIMDTMLNALSSFPSKMIEVGKNAIKGVWEGIKNMKSWITEKVKSLGSTLLNAVKSALGIASPSKVFRDQVGKNIALGIGEGFSDEMENVSKQMQDEIPILDVDDPSFNGGSGGVGGGALNYQAMVNAFKEALGQMTVELDDRQVGKFVKKTVEQAIYT
jgi:phage-related protein